MNGMDGGYGAILGGIGTIDPCLYGGCDEGQMGSGGYGDPAANVGTMANPYYNFLGGAGGYPQTGGAYSSFGGGYGEGQNRNYIYPGFGGSLGDAFGQSGGFGGGYDFGS